MAIRRAGVVGCGLLGSGIAQTCVQSGYETVVRPSTPIAPDGAIRNVWQEKRQGFLRVSIIARREPHVTCDFAVQRQIENVAFAVQHSGLCSAAT
jgi:3-hydroxyacyl-CoA dehydrogenase